MITTTTTISSMPFHCKIAKSIFEYHMTTNGVITKDGENFNFYRKPTDKQAKYVGGKSGEFIADDGKIIQFSPFGESVMFNYLHNFQK